MMVVSRDAGNGGGASFFWYATGGKQMTRGIKQYDLYAKTIRTKRKG